MENKENFNYTYSAKRQEEIIKIRKKYIAPIENEDKMSQLRRLDKGVNSKATTAALIVGIVGALIMGIGMSLVMTDIGAVLGEIFSIAVGTGIGIVGIVLVCLAYPVYNSTVKRERKRIAPEILRLTDELMK